MLDMACFLCCIECEFSCSPPDYCKPSFRTTLAEGELLQVGPSLDPGWLNGFNVPSLSEGGVQFLFRYPTRTLSSRLLVAEAHQVKATAWLQDRRQPLGIAFPVLIGKNVEQARVDHVVEALRPVLERHGVLHQEGDVQSSLGGFEFSPPNRLFQEVDARDLVAPAGKEKGRVAR